MGYLALRHALTPFLLEEGGHIGFSVRPSRRREGHATRALALALPRASALGLDQVLITCDDDNEGSRRTIEHNGGVYEDTRKGKRRYWIDVGSPSPCRSTSQTDWVLLRIADPGQPNLTPGPYGHPGNDLGIAYTSPWWL